MSTWMILRIGAFTRAAYQPVNEGGTSIHGLQSNDAGRR